MPRPFQTYHLPDELAGNALPAVLRGVRPGLSWSQAEQLIKSRRVAINGNLCLDAGRRLKTGDVIRVSDQSQALPPGVKDVRIRYLDADLVIVEKPAGMTTLRHAEEKNWPARRKQLQPTLAEVLPDAIAQRLREQGRRSAAGPRVRPVHRLDRETSGVMVFALNPAAEQHLIRQFAKHTVHRAYIAVVQGRVEPRTIESQFVRDRGDGKRGSAPAGQEGERAVTHVRPLEHLDGYTVVECRLETGRTHQIRIHLAEAGHVVCGEKMYHHPLGGEPVVDRSGAPRVALHAAELGLEHPVTGAPLHVTAPLPGDLRELLVRLGANLPKTPLGQTSDQLPKQPPLKKPAPQRGAKASQPPRGKPAKPRRRRP